MSPTTPIAIAAASVFAAGSMIVPSMVAAAEPNGPARSAPATTTDALIELLVRKGIITREEAEAVLAEFAPAPTHETAAAPVDGTPAAQAPEAATTVSSSGNATLQRVRLTGRLQAQTIALSTDIADTAEDPANVNHAFLRRVYVGLKAQLFPDWSAYLNYDFAGSTFDAATLTWSPHDTFNLGLGLRKAPIGLEENFTSSGALKAIERSPATRYFVESNNGRRLGAGSYRQGIWLNGEHSNLSYSLAVTNPERAESSEDAAAPGDASNNTLAYWAHVAYGDRPTDDIAWRVGLSAGMLPDQGGSVLGVGDDLAVASLFAEGSLGAFAFAAEYFWGDNDNGAAPGRDAQPTAFFLQPSYRIGHYEAVVRFSRVDSDGRGVALSDGVRSAASGGTMDRLEEWFFGANWYIAGNDAKVQAGYIFAETEDTVTGAPARARARGVRTQVQVQF